MGALSQSSDQSGNGQSAVLVEAPESMKGSPQSNGAEVKYKTKKLRKYKNNAEKVFSLFSSPRQQST
jgi:serum/glucocorticoid-regulated kinase 2